MKTVKRAARPTGVFQCRPPPKNRDVFNSILGTELSDEAWMGITRAYSKFYKDLRALETSKASRSKNDEAGWHHRKDKVCADLENAMKGIDRARTKHGDFLCEASENHCLRSRGHSYPPEYSASALLEDAYMKLIHAIAIIERAEPIEYDTLTDAEARRELTCDIAAALPADVSRVSDGRVLCDEASEADLTPFEQLISCLGIHEGARPSATAAWVRKALKGRKRG